MPKVSVVIPTYNRPDVVRDRAVKSIQEQTYQDWECIVVDSSADDATRAVIEALAKADTRIRYIKMGADGQSAARNLGVRNSHGAYIAFTDDDDAFLPNYLELAVKTFESAPPDITFLSGSTIIRDYHGRETYSFPQIEPFWRFPIGGGWFFKRKVFFEDNLFFQEGWRGFEDMDLNIRFHLSGQKAIMLPDLVRVYYTAAGSDVHSWSKNYEQQRRDFDKFYAKYHDLYDGLGDEGIAYISRFGGTIYLQVGDLRAGRKFLWRAFRLKPRVLDILYIGTSYFGHGAFLRLDAFKSRVMRILRATALNRIPSGLRR